MSYFLIQRDTQRYRVRVESFPLSIGRDPVNGIALDDPGASRFHVKIKKRNLSHIIQDLGSKNGTYLNGEKIINSVLRNNDQIQIGNTTLTFVHASNLHKSIEDTLALELKEIANHPLSAKDLTLRRIDPSQMIKECEQKTINCKRVYECHANLTLATDMNDVSQQLLARIKEFMPTIINTALFTWNDKTNSLSPLAFKNYQSSTHFKIDSAHLAQVINRHQVLLLDSPQTSIAILPMLLFGIPICLAHLEFPLQPQSEKALGLIQTLLQRCAPHFEMLSLYKELNNWSMSMIKSITRTLEEKDTYTMGHSERVGKYALGIATELGLDPKTKHNLLASALCHDVGKIGIPDSILKKSDLLRSDEYEEMKLHPVLGAEIIGHIPNSKDFISGVLYHHERWNGTGYPEGLAGEKIPFFGRIIAVADSFDAMVSGRSYSGFISAEEAFEKLLIETDLYDTEILESFAKAWQNNRIKIKTDTLIQKARGKNKDNKEK